jgi:hypothetical protein
LAVDHAAGQVYFKDYRLRGVGSNIEVWVAHDSDEVSTNVKFQRGDCRNDARATITDGQVGYLIQQFDDNILPDETRVFSSAPARDGTNALLTEALGLPTDYFQGEGGNVVVLVDNVRDENFYDRNNSQNLPYVAGFFSSSFNDLVDRNVMTIDAWDWLHRTTATPEHEPVASDNCASAPARPFLYESTFAHEYQHLLEHYEDLDEVSWVNEGLSMWSEIVTEYSTPDVPISQVGHSSHVQCFLGFRGRLTDANPNPSPGGPENSLTQWQDQGSREVVCDYGAAYTFMLLLEQRYGEDFMTALHREDGNGLGGLRTLLDAEGANASDVIHDWAAMVALDQVLDAGAMLHGGTTDDLQVDALNARVNWRTPNAFATRGAPPNGSDYVRLRTGGRFLDAASIDRIGFDGADTLPPLRVRWRIDRTPPRRSGNPALYSGSGANLDRAVVRRIRVPATRPWLAFDTKWRTERGWDFGFVQVSTDGGRTYRSLGNRHTIPEPEPEAVETVRANVPGFTGSSRGWRTVRFNLRRYAGERILLAFRYVTDPLMHRPGWWVDRVKVGGKVVSAAEKLGRWRSPTQIRPKRVSGFTLQLVAHTSDRSEAWIAPIILGPGWSAVLDAQQVEAAVGNSAELVAAIVTYDEPTESIGQYAPYRLTVNGERQPGG